VVPLAKSKYGWHVVTKLINVATKEEVPGGFPGVGEWWQRIVAGESNEWMSEQDMLPCASGLGWHVMYKVPWSWTLSRACACDALTNCVIFQELWQSAAACTVDNISS
jgi:hypothetical protein